jgi:hypothetical protein
MSASFIQNGVVLAYLDILSVINVPYNFPTNSKLYRIPTKESKFIDLYKSHRSLDASRCYSSITSSLEKLAMMNHDYYKALRVTHNCPWNHSVGIEQMLKTRLVNRFESHARHYNRIGSSHIDDITESKLVCIPDNGNPSEFFVFGCDVTKRSQRNASNNETSLDNLVPAISAIGKHKIQYDLTRQFHQVQKDVLALKKIAMSHIGYQESIQKTHLIMVRLGKSLNLLRNTIHVLTSLGFEYLEIYSVFLKEMESLLHDNRLLMPNVEKQAKCLVLQSEFLLQELQVTQTSTGELKESFLMYAAFVVTSFESWLGMMAKRNNFKDIFRYLCQVGLAIYDFDGVLDTLYFSNINLGLISGKNRNGWTMNPLTMTINVPVDESILVQSEKNLSNIRLHFLSQENIHDRPCREYLEMHNGLLLKQPRNAAEFRQYVNSLHLEKFAALISMNFETCVNGFHQAELEVLEKFNLDVSFN